MDLLALQSHLPPQRSLVRVFPQTSDAPASASDASASARTDGVWVIKLGRDGWHQRLSAQEAHDLHELLGQWLDGPDCLLCGEPYRAHSAAAYLPGLSSLHDFVADGPDPR